MPEVRRAEAPSPFRTVDSALGRRVLVETPEHVGIGFELGGLGSRAAAYVVDAVLVYGVVLALVMGWYGLAVGSGGGALWTVGLSVVVLIVFALQWGYFFVGEAFFNGRTIGKRAVGLRVIGEGGVPVTTKAAALRNLLRIVDLQPIGSGLLGLALIGFHPRAQRLGDILAGTVVVKDRADQEIPERQAASDAVGRPQLTARQFEVLERYLSRMESLPRKVRLRIGGRIAKAMGDVIERHPRRTSTPLDDLLRELYEREKPLRLFATGTSRQAVELVRRQTAEWDRCRELIDQARKRGLRTLSEAQVEEFTRLYRVVVADLARAHTYGASLRLRFFLEGLAGEAHNRFYRSDEHRGFSLVGWLRSGFPRTVRRRRIEVAIAVALLFLPATLITFGVEDDPETGRQILSPAMVARAEEAGDRLARGEPYIDVPSVQMSLFASSVMTNNVQVAFVAAAGGILVGLGTVLLLVFNGVHLGAVVGLYHAYSAGPILWTFVAPHGVAELTAIAVSAAAGLTLARAILIPGRRTRRQALFAAGSDALSLVAGAGFLLVLAGLVEGFVSPARIPPGFKWAFAAVIALLLAGYLLLGGRDADGVRAGRAS